MAKKVILDKFRQAGDLLECLEMAVQHAKEQQIVGYALTTVQRDGTVSSIYAKGRHHFQLIGAIESLKHRLINE